MPGLNFPNEPDHYREARNKLLKAEIDLRAQVEQVAAMRRGLPVGGPVKEDYAFEEMARDGQVRAVKLSELFAGSKTSLFVYSWMYGPSMKTPCPMCSSFLDALDGNALQLNQRINLAVIARSPVERITAFARARGWKALRFLSSSKNSYNADYFGETSKGDQYPMANVFVLRDGLIHHSWGSEMLYAGLEGDPRHLDMMWPLWNVLDTTPEGRGRDWYPPLNV